VIVKNHFKRTYHESSFLFLELKVIVQFDCCKRQTDKSAGVLGVHLTAKLNDLLLIYVGYAIPCIIASKKFIKFHLMSLRLSDIRNSRYRTGRLIFLSIYNDLPSS
jgi:hypothetical protein